MVKTTTAQTDKTPPVTSVYATPEKSETTHALSALRLKFKATADWIVLRKSGRPVAEMFFTFYALDQKGKTSKNRPLTFLFNGGPGAASAYLHLGVAGPWRVDFGEAGEYLAPPVSLVENRESWLPFTDLVFVDPVGTGYSRAAEESRNEREPFRYDKGEKDDTSKLHDRAQQEQREFFAVHRDIQSLVDFITQFLSRFGRWESPVSIAGESYGGYRVGRLVRALHESGGVGLSNAILVSPALDLIVHDRSDYDVLPWIDEFPTMALAAAFHGKSRSRLKKASMLKLAEEAEQFAAFDFSKLLISGDMLPLSQRNKLLTRVADLLGLEQSLVVQKGGRIPFWIFVKELLRDQQKLCGMYDASGTTTDPFPNHDYSSGPDHATSLSTAFASGIYAVLNNKLKINPARTYHLLSYEVFNQWRLDQERNFMQSQLNSVDDFRFGVAVNPFLKILIAHGYYDLVTPYFRSQRLVAQMRLTEEQYKQVKLVNYSGGHMYYTWEKSRRDFTNEVRRQFA